MSTVINAINYLFNPDQNTQALCEQIADDIDGNGACFTDVTAESVTQTDVTVISHFSWTILVNLKTRVLAGKNTKNIKLHENANIAQTAAKKQGQEIILKSLGKIELVNNINDDPAHFFKNSSVKLSGGPVHAYTQKCSNQCNHGQLTCTRCNGKGNNKATTKKEDFLGTGTNLSTKNLCPQCSGKGTIECHTCSGTGETTHLFEINVTATSKYKNIVECPDQIIKAQIEHFLAQHTCKNLLKYYLTPKVQQLEDIDQNHCKVSYKSKTKCSTLKLNVLKQTYDIIGFGKNTYCINKPQILDEILLPAINDTIGSNPKMNSAGKYLKLQSFSLLSNILNSEYNKRSDEELEFILNKKSNQLLSKEAIHSILDQLSLLKTHLTPRYSLLPWVILICAGVFSGFYFGLSLSSLKDTGILIATHLIGFISSAYLISSNLTKHLRKKLNQSNSIPTLEKLPVLIATVLITSSIMLPNLISTDSRWSIYFTVQKTISLVHQPRTFSNSVISNPKLITLAQGYLTTLGYKNINNDGNYDSATEYAVKDFQQQFNIKGATFLDVKTMTQLTKYATIKKSSFTKQ